MRLLASLLLISTCAMPVTSQTHSGGLELEISALGLGFQHVSQADENGISVFQDAVISGDAITINATRLTHNPATGALTLEGVRILDPEAPRGAQVEIRELQADTIGSLFVARNTPMCEPGTTGLRPGRIATAGFAVRPVSMIGSPTTHEGFRADRMVIDYRYAPDLSCANLVSGEMRGVAGTGPDRSTTLMDTISVHAGMGQPGAAMLNLEARSISMQAPTGLLVGTIGSIALSVSGQGIGDLAPTRDLSALLDQVMTFSSTTRFSIRNVFLAAPDGVSGSIQGDVNITLSHDREDLQLVADGDLSGLGQASVDLGLRILPASQAMGLAAVAGDVPGIEVVERLAFTGLRFSAADTGAMHLLESRRGMDREAALRRLRGVMTGTPDAVSEPVISFVTGVLNGGAGFTASPPQPVGLTQLVMTGILQPAMLGSVLGIASQ